MAQSGIRFGSGLSEQRFRAALDGCRPDDAGERRHPCRTRPAAPPLLVHRMITEVEQPAGSDAQRIGDPGGAEVRSDREAQRPADEGRAFPERAPAQGLPAGLHRGSQNSAQRDPFGNLVQGYGERHSDAQSQGRR